MKTMKLSVLFLVAVMIIITSCNKEEDAKPAASMNKATITGYVYADLDMTEPGDEYVPAGTKIFTIINSADFLLSPDPGVVYPYKYYEGNVDASGKYSITIDVGNKPLQNVVLYGNDFWYERQMSITMTQLTAFRLPPNTSGTVFPKQTVIRNVKYFPL